MSRKSWTVFWLAALLLLFVFNGSLLITDSVESNYALTALRRWWYRETGCRRRFTDNIGLINRCFFTG